jgi:4-diphosphocytidyl-2-C-methyl-D-erythritol kinase
MEFHRFAAAKINLFLHVGDVGVDGYHPISSLMVFADIGDDIRLRPAAQMGLVCQGPFAAELNDDQDNLVLRARERFLDALRRRPAPFLLTLDKQLPIAAGLGGGSADAAATLGLLAKVAGRLGWAAPGPAAVESIARDLGADVAACLACRNVLAEGRGDQLSAAPAMPGLDAVLVNPGVPSSTAAVYRAFDEAPSAGGANRPDLPGAFGSPLEVAAFLKVTRNDLEAPAVVLQPLIGEALAALAREPESLLARMSGSGSTCFSLCRDAGAATAMAGRLAQVNPGWWVRACRLGAAGVPK